MLGNLGGLFGNEGRLVISWEGYYFFGTLRSIVSTVGTIYRNGLLRKGLLVKG